MFEEACFICGKPTAGSLYCSDQCKLLDTASSLSSAYSSPRGAAHPAHPLIDVPALSPYQRAYDPDSDVPEHSLGESAVHTPSTSPTSSLITEGDEDDLQPRRHVPSFAKSLPQDMTAFARRDHEEVGARSYQDILQNYQRPPAAPSHPNLSSPIPSRVSGNLQFTRVPAKVNGSITPTNPPSRGQDRSVSDSQKRVQRYLQSSPSRRHSFPTLLNLGLSLPSPQPSPELLATKPYSDRARLGFMARHSSSSYSARPKLTITSTRATTFPPSPPTPRVQLRPTESQAIAALHRASDSTRSRTPAPREREDTMTTPTQARQKEAERGRSRQRGTHGGRSRSRSASRSHAALQELSGATDATVRQVDEGRGRRGILPTFGIGGLRRVADRTSGEREEVRGRRGWAS